MSSFLAKFSKPSGFSMSDALVAAGILTAAKAFQVVAEGAVTFLACQAKQLARAVLVPMLTSGGAGGGKGAGKGGGKGGSTKGAGKGGSESSGGKGAGKGGAGEGASTSSEKSMGSRVFTAPYVERMKNMMLNSFLGVTEEKAKT